MTMRFFLVFLGLTLAVARLAVLICMPFRCAPSFLPYLYIFCGHGGRATLVPSVTVRCVGWICYAYCLKQFWSVFIFLYCSILQALCGAQEGMEAVRAQQRATATLIISGIATLMARITIILTCQAGRLLTRCTGIILLPMPFRCAVVGFAHWFVVLSIRRLYCRLCAV